MYSGRKIITADCRNKTCLTADSPETFTLLGGRGLTSEIVSQHVPPDACPLGKENILVFAPGLVSGSRLSSSNRLSAGAKSPLTNGIKESNSGGMISLKLSRLGVNALVLRDIPDGDDFHGYGILVKKDSAVFVDLSNLKGMNTYEAADTLRDLFGKKCGLMVIGTAGERKLAAACINVTDAEGEPCRNLGRGGLGAVMGSKGIKAIIVDDSGCDDPYADNPEMRGLVKDFARELLAHPVTGGKFARYGTSMALPSVNAFGGLPTRNFSCGEYEFAEQIGPETLHATIRDRGGMGAHACMPGCVIRCSNKYVSEDGSPVVGSVDYENICLLGSNLGISSLDEIAELNFLCNDIGIDTIETGAALGVMAEGKCFSFGDFQAIRSVIREIGEGTPLGLTAGSGAANCGKVFGVTRVPTVKGQAMAAYDPRAIKGQGVTYAMSPMGADHTASNAIVLGVDHLDPAVQVDAVRDLQVNTTVLDMLGLCMFTARVSLEDKSLIERMVKAVVGRPVSFGELQRLAVKILFTEREFNRRAGLGPASDDIPAFMRTEELLPNNSVFDIPGEELDRFFGDMKSLYNES